MKYENLLIGATGSAGVLALPSYLTMLSSNFKHIRIIITDAATEIVEPRGLGLFADEVYTKGTNLNKYSHIKLAEWADCFVVLPATANILGKAANGIADDFLSTTILTYGSTVIFCPNMNERLWLNPIVQLNVMKLKENGYKFIGPVKQEAYTTASKKITPQYVVPDFDVFSADFRDILIKD